MINTPTVNRRFWPRELVRLPAQYFIKNQSNCYLNCTIVNLSRNGAGVLFPLIETLKIGAVVFLDVVVPKTLEQLTIRGRISRVYQDDNRLGAAIHFEKLLSEAVFANLCIK